MPQFRAMTDGDSRRDRASDLVGRAVHGDHDAFSQLVSAELPRLHGLAGLVLGDRTRVEDALQEALLRAWRDLPRLRKPDRFHAWLRRLVINAAYDEGRRLRRRRGEVSLDPQYVPAAGGGFGEIDRRDQLDRAFRHLDEKDRAVVALRYYLDLPSAEAAAALGMRDGTYRSRLHRAMRRLAGVMARDPGPAAQPQARGA